MRIWLYEAVSMKLQQLRYLTEVARRGLNVSEAAEALHTSQPGVSKQIRALEEELGDRCVRAPRQAPGLDHRAGQGGDRHRRAHPLRGENLRRAGEEFANEKLGTLTIAATHTQARYALPKAVAAVQAANIRSVQLRHPPGQPDAGLRAGARRRGRLCVATEAIALYPELVSLPVYQWNRCVVVPPKHPLLKVTPLTLEALGAVSRS